jgi:hypothetical protein
VTKMARVWAQKQTWRPMERNKPTQLQPLIPNKDAKKHMLEKRQTLQQMVKGKVDAHMWQAKTGSLSLTLYKTPLQMDHISKCKKLWRNHDRKSHWKHFKIQSRQRLSN